MSTWWHTATSVVTWSCHGIIVSSKTMQEKFQSVSLSSNEDGLDASPSKNAVEGILNLTVGFRCFAIVDAFALVSVYKIICQVAGAAKRIRGRVGRIIA